MAKQRLAFRSAFLPSLSIALVSLLMAVGIGVGILLLRYGLAVNWGAVVVRLLWVAIATFALILAVVLLFRVYLSQEGLRCYTFWGNYHTLLWPDIDSVRPINMLGLRYLRVGSSQSGHTVWVPLFLADMLGFRAAVHEFAGEDHILSRALT